VITVRRRLLALLLPALALLMLAGGFADYLIAARATRGAYDRALASDGAALAAGLRAQDGRWNWSPSVRGSGELYAIVGADGSLIAGARQLPPLTPPRTGTVFGDAEFLGRRVREAAFISDTPLGPVTVTVAETLERRQRAERLMLAGKLAVDFVELDVTLLLIWVALYYGLRPLGRLHDAVEARTPRELQRFDEDEVPGEVKPLVRAFNRLLELLHDAAASQRRFVADAAHQMRTPVAGIMAQLELLLKHPVAAAISAELNAINRGIQQLAHAANQLLALARAEPLSTQPEQFQPVALQPLIGELVERNVDRAEKAGLDLGAEAQPAEVIGDAWLLDDLVSNLIDNALKYTPRHGHVTVRCGRGADGAAFIEVEDDGPGIPEAERSRVRERFYRRPGSAGSGAGLGLAIVDEIARVHHAALSIAGGAAGGTRMQVKFQRRRP
jgi:two-component system sensor histidine kinase TctE